MKNALIYFYNIYVDHLEEIMDRFYFKHKGNDFVIMPYFYTLEEVVEIYNLNKEMIGRGIDTYEIALTNFNSVLFEYDNSYYILMKMPGFNNRVITYDDVLKFNLGTSINVKHLNKSNWPYYWERKVDFIEYQFLQFENKYPMISDSINYYIGRFENAISYYSQNVVETRILQVVHRRVNVDMDLLEFYNPLNLIIDYKERDLAEYFKSFIYNKNYSSSLLENMLLQYDFKPLELSLFISRVLAPTNYFDVYDNVLNGKGEDSDISSVIDREGDFIYFMKILFSKFSNYNIAIVDWIKKEE